MTSVLIWALLLVGFVAAAVPFLKSRVAEGMLALGTGVVAWLGGFFLGQIGALVVAAVFCGVAIFAASRPPRSQSAWARAGKRDRHGRRIRYEQPPASWVGHTFLGAILGLSPGVAVMVVASVLENWDILTATQTQPANFGAPMALVGAASGAMIGANYVPAGHATDSEIDTPRHDVKKA